MLTPDEATAFAQKRCPIRFTPKDFYRQQDWWKDQILDLTDEDLEPVFKACTSRWRQSILIDEAKRRAKRHEYLQANALDVFGVLLNGRLL